MARRGKTKLGGAVDTGAMLRAGKAQEGVAQAETRRTAFAERKGQTARQGAAAADQAIKYDVEQRKEQTRYDAQQAQQQEQTQFSQGLQGRQQDLKEEQFEAGLAEKGIERAGGVEQEMAKGEQQDPLMGPPTPEQQRLREQGDKPVEMPTARGGFVQSEARQAKQQAETAAKIMGAEANLMRARTAHQKAFFQQDKEAMEKAEKQLLAPARAVNVKLERVIGAAQDPTKAAGVDWGGLKEAYSDNPNVQQEIESKQVGPNLIRLMRSELSYEGLKYFASTGKTPGEDLWDPTSPMGRQFTEAVNMQGMLAATLTGGHGVFTLAEKNRQLQQKAAQMMLYEMNMQKQEGPEEEKPLPPTFGGPAPAGPAAPVFAQQHPGYEPREVPGGGGTAVRGLSPEERQRSEQIEGVSGPPAAGTPGAPKETLRSQWEREREEQRQERRNRRGG